MQNALYYYIHLVVRCLYLFKLIVEVSGAEAEARC